jgi:hypothetical protein
MAKSYENNDENKRILIVSENLEEYQDVADELKSRGVDYVVVGDGNAGREEVASGEFSAVYLPSLFVGVNGQCASNKYLEDFFALPPKDISDEERVSMNEGLSILVEAREEGQEVPIFYSDDFAYCMEVFEGIESILSYDAERVVDALVGK